MREEGVRAAGTIWWVKCNFLKEGIFNPSNVLCGSVRCALFFTRILDISGGGVEGRGKRMCTSDRNGQLFRYIIT